MSALSLEPDSWVIVRHYSDNSGLLDTFGPFDSEESAEAVKGGLDVLVAETLTVDSTGRPSGRLRLAVAAGRPGRTGRQVPRAWA